MNSDILIYLVFAAFAAYRVFATIRKNKRFGDHTDPVRFRVCSIRRRHPEDHLYDDDGKINRNWRP